MASTIDRDSSVDEIPWEAAGHHRPAPMPGKCQATPFMVTIPQKRFVKLMGETEVLCKIVLSNLKRLPRFAVKV